jgi:nanoRNase/pAp phosphatase (c-di-AMP/oligoRNAs hydrolase)
VTSAATKRSDRHLSTLSGKRAVILTHDNPDPDAIAAGWALVVMLRRVLGQTSRLVGRGAIVRAENLHMIRLLDPPLELVDEIPNDDAAYVLVDCIPTASNHPLKEKGAWPTAVVDHHEPNGTRFRVPFRDVRPRVAATAAITAGYLREQSLEPAPELATAMLYAMRTEITAEQRSMTPLDRRIISWLSTLADHGKLAEISGAPLSRGYFSDLLLALENVFLYEDAAVCILPSASGTEIVGEVADLLIRCEGIHKVLCSAAVGNDIVLSGRTTLDGGNVVALLSATLHGFGHCGGHQHRAGGKLPGGNRDRKLAELLQKTIKERWLAACHVDSERGSRLVRKQAILENL